jgi:hypothetical protein
VPIEQDPKSIKRIYIPPGLGRSIDSLTSLENRLKCPLCGSRRVSIVFDLPKEPNAMHIAGCRAASDATAAILAC